jgi:hypothetical protein
MEDIKWSSSGMLGVLAANNLGFGYRLWLKSATFSNSHSTKRA